jgi:hypothetical protein
MNKICPFMSNGSQKVHCTPDCELANIGVNSDGKPTGESSCSLGNFPSLSDLEELLSNQ